MFKALTICASVSFFVLATYNNIHNIPMPIIFIATSCIVVFVTLKNTLAIPSE